MDPEECLEEQAMEVEALQAIFEEDEVIIRSPTEYQIILVPITGDLDGSKGDNFVGVKIDVTYPPAYPQVAPTLSFSPHLLLTLRQCDILTKIGKATAEECVGDVCIFSVTEALKEWLDDNNEAPKTMHEEFLDRQNEAQAEEAAIIEKEVEAKEEKEQQRVISSKLVKPGTIVTYESFAEWQTLFKAERKAERDALIAAGELADEKEVRLTGREIFEKNILLGLEKAEEKAEERLQKALGGHAGKQGEGDAEADEVFWFNESAYLDEDLPSSSSEESDPEE